MLFPASILKRVSQSESSNWAHNFRAGLISIIVVFGFSPNTDRQWRNAESEQNFRLKQRQLRGR